jgi:Sec-independent protein translocase protein TatA
MDNTVIETLSLVLGAGWASGINLYATILVLGFGQALGYANLPSELSMLSNPMVLSSAGLMYCIEFFTDKTPGVDTAWDGLHTFIRIPAGALIAAGAAGGFDMGQAAEFAAALVGGGLAAGSHLTKAGSRVLINTSPEPFSNWTASVTEDIAVVGGLWAALNHPWLFIVFLLLFVLLLIWILPKLWRAIGQLFGKIRRFFGGEKAQDRPSSATDEEPSVLHDLFKKTRDKAD